MVLTLGGFLAIEGWWFSSQREFVFTAESLRTHSWLDIVLRRAGIQMRVTEVTAAALIYDRGNKLVLETSAGRLAFWAAIWDPRAISQLMSSLASRGIPTRADWGPDTKTWGEG